MRRVKRPPLLDGSANAEARRSNGALTWWPALGALLLCYTLCLLLLLPRYTLWLDEILDLRTIKNFDFRLLIAAIPGNAGGVPLSYVVRFVSIHLLGYSLFAGRLPSAICSVVAAVGIFMLARQLRLRFPLLAVIFFCVTPLQFRYAIESRPYSQVLAISVWASLIFLRLIVKPDLKNIAIYTVLLLAGLYTQPYMLFVAIGHLIWLLWASVPQKKWLSIVIGASIAIACLGFLPWYLWAARLWSESIQTSHLHYVVEAKSVLLLLKELVGAGYAGTVLTLIAAAWGWKSDELDRNERLFWLLQFFVPMILAIVADQVFGYFLAIRQMIFLVVPLSLLAALGIERFGRVNWRAGMAVAAILVLVFLAANLQFMVKPREDWDGAVALLKQSTTRNACVVFWPASQSDLYCFLAPELCRHLCPSSGDYSGMKKIAVGTYGATDTDALGEKLMGDGFRKWAAVDRRGPKVEVYERDR